MRAAFEATEGSNRESVAAVAGWKVEAVETDAATDRVNDAKYLVKRIFGFIDRDGSGTLPIIDLPLPFTSVHASLCFSLPFLDLPLPFTSFHCLSVLFTVFYCAFVAFQLRDCRTCGDDQAGRRDHGLSARARGRVLRRCSFAPVFVGLRRCWQPLFCDGFLVPRNSKSAHQLIQNN